MIRRFCDVCKDEITDKNSTSKLGHPLGRMQVRIKRKGVDYGVEVIHSTNGTSNAGDVCMYCVLDALRELDDRPRVV